MLNKAQKAKKAQYIEEIVRESWDGKEDWIKYYNGEIDRVVELENGCMYAIEKPSIKKDFCFGYSLNRCDSESYDRANAAAANARTNVNRFIEENLQQIDVWIGAISDPDREIYHGVRYSNAPQDSKIHDIQVLRLTQVYQVMQGYVKCTDAEREAILNGYKDARKDFEKRLQTYLKRYGLSKVNSWTYWQDA